MQNSPLDKSMVKRTAHFLYDFSIHGGAIGDITLENDVIPDDALVVSGAVHVKTALTSDGSATIAMYLLTAADVLAATAVASYSLAANIVVKQVPQTASTWLKMTAKKNLKLTVAVAALTAGKAEIFLDYYMGI